MARATSPKSTATQEWRSVSPAPVVLLYGNDEYFVSRTEARLRSSFRELNVDSEFVSLNAKDYSKGELDLVASPSLFGNSKIIEVKNLASMSEDFLQDALKYCANPETDNMLVMHHSGGNRGKKLLDTVRASRKLLWVETKPLKTENDKVTFVNFEFREHHKKIEPQAIRLLVAAAGNDTAELASACLQLINDGPETITENLVDIYYGGRTEASAFKVSDAAVAGDSRQALKLLRHALDTGVEPIPLVGALAMRIRNIARVHGSRGNAAGLASELKMAPWQVEQAQRDSRRYSDVDLSNILRVLADVDSQLKGESADPMYSLEKAVLTIARAR